MTGNLAQRTRGAIVKRVAFSCALLALILVFSDFAAWLLARLAQSPDPKVTLHGLIYVLRPGRLATMDLGQLYPENWKPGFVVGDFTVADNGFRVPPLPATKEPGEFRVICLGDSSTMGLGVGDTSTWPIQLERMLRSSMPGRPVHVLNAGILGHTSRQGLCLFRERLIQLRPDLITWAYGFNDAYSMPLFPRMDVSLIPLQPDGRVPFRFQVKFLLFKQPLFQLMNQGLASNVFRFKLATIVVNRDRASSLKAPTQTADDYRDARVPPADFADNLRAMIWLGREKNFKLVCLNLNRLPTPYFQIHKNISREYNVAFLDVAAMFDKIFAADSLPDPYRQAFEPYRRNRQPQAVKNPTLLLTVDGLHPNAVGCRMIAANLHDLIVSGSFP